MGAGVGAKSHGFPAITAAPHGRRGRPVGAGVTPRVLCVCVGGDPMGASGCPGGPWVGVSPRRGCASARWVCGGWPTSAPSAPGPAPRRRCPPGTARSPRCGRYWGGGDTHKKSRVGGVTTGDNTPPPPAAPTVTPLRTHRGHPGVAGAPQIPPHPPKKKGRSRCPGVPAVVVRLAWGTRSCNGPRTRALPPPPPWLRVIPPHPSRTPSAPRRVGPPRLTSRSRRRRW